MKYVLSFILLIATFRGNAQESTQYFPLPLIPDSISNLNQRCNYMVNHYWDFCDTKRAFSSRDKMAEAFKIYLSFMPYATADSVIQSIDKFLKRIEKQPNDVTFITDQAIIQLYSDSSDFVSDPLCLKFLDAAIANGKVKKEDKLRYKHLSTVLHNSLNGNIAPDFTYSDCSGSQHTFNTAEPTAIATVLFFNDPECDECRMARMKLEADIHASKLIDSGALRIASITPDEATAEWCKKTAHYPEKWTVGASENIDEIYDLRLSPSFYLLSPDGKIVLKHCAVEDILNITRLLRVQQKETTEESDSASTAEQ